MPVLKPRSRTLPSCIAALLLCLVCGPSPAHEGHHDDDVVRPAAAASASASVLDAPPLEVVARREGPDLVFYVDDYASNAPLDDLQLSLHRGAVTLQAAGGDGVYRVAADLVDGAGAQTLELEVHGEGVDTHLQLALPPEQAALTASASSPIWPYARGISIALLVLLVGSFGWVRRRKRAGRALRGAGAA
jgi:hypothetical protein